MFFVHNKCNLLYDIKYILGIAITAIVSIVITMMASDACHLGPPLTYNFCTPDLIDDKLDVSSLSNESGVFSDYHGNSQCSSPVESEASYIEDISQDVPLQPLDENNSKSQTILPHHNCGTTQHVFDSPNHDINKQSSSDKWYVNGDPNIAATEHYHTVATGYNVTQRQLIQSVKYSTTTTLSQSTNYVSKPKRKRIINSIQRNAANKRERKRMMNLNFAFDALKEKVPTFRMRANYLE